MTEKLIIHLHGGTKILATVESNDLADESERVTEFNETHSTTFDTEVENALQLVESALTVPPKPRWVWIGDAYVFTQAVAGVECGSEIA